ncbi:MAG TPA: flagellar hook-length control protein FliK [Epulopiscium sp.]|nr:flagellar hook-length control protein FliK [Candidatus Epulonipiscium sp.]
MNISFDRQHNATQMRPTNIPRTEAISEGVNKLLLQNIKIGDLFNVEIIDSLQKQIRVMLADGTIFEAQLDHPLDLHIGQQVTFQVKDILGKQIQMEMLLQGKPGQQEGNVDINTILKQLDIPVTQDSQDAVKFLMQKMLPVTKDSIKQIEFGLKSSQLSIDSLLSMLENDISITPTTLKQIQAYENGEIRLQGQLEVMIENILVSDDRTFLEHIHKILSEAKEQIDQIGQKEQNVLKEQSLPKEDGMQENPTSVREELKGSEQLQGKDATDFTKQIRPKGQAFNAEPLMNKDMISLKKEIADIFKETFFIDPGQLKDKAENKLQKINELYKEIYKLADKLEKLEEQAPEKQIADKPKTQLYSDIKSNIEFLTIANKYDTMIHIPLVIQNQYKHGELYVFNNKKKGKKSYHEASMLISLETVSLGTVESFIKKYNNQISIQFKTDHEDIEIIIKNKIQLLKAKLKDKGYDLISATYIPNTQPFLIKEETPSETNTGRYRFDTKA